MAQNEELNRFQEELTNTSSWLIPHKEITMQEWTEFLNEKFKQMGKIQHDMAILEKQVASLKAEAHIQKQMGLNSKNINPLIVVVIVFILISWHIFQQINQQQTHNQQRMNDLHAYLKQINQQPTRNQQRMNDVNASLGELKADVNNIKIKMDDTCTKLQRVKSLHDELYDQIIDMHMNEMIKQQRSMHILQKYSNAFPFVVDRNIPWLHQFVMYGNNSKIKKVTDSEKMIYSNKPIPAHGLHHFSIKIVSTTSKKISIGLMPQSKKTQDCIYCDSTQLYYLYCKNANIYNGEFLNLVNKYKQTKFDSINVGDIITVFVDAGEREVIWYVNSKFAGKEVLADHTRNQNMYPFIEVSEKGDKLQMIS